jgi:hypothetical protein
MSLGRNEFENFALCSVGLLAFLSSRPYAFGVSDPMARAFEPAASRCFPAPFPAFQWGLAYLFSAVAQTFLSAGSGDFPVPSF